MAGALTGKRYYCLICCAIASESSIHFLDTYAENLWESPRMRNYYPIFITFGAALPSNTAIMFFAARQDIA